MLFLCLLQSFLHLRLCSFFLLLLLFIYLFIFYFCKMLVAIQLGKHARFLFYFWNFQNHICLPWFMPCYMRMFCFWYMSAWIHGNLNVENKMRGMGKRTYLVVRNSGNVSLGCGASLLIVNQKSWKLLNECELKDACRRFTHCNLGIWKTLEWMWAQDACCWLTHCRMWAWGCLSPVHPL